MLSSRRVFRRLGSTICQNPPSAEVASNRTPASQAAPRDTTKPPKPKASGNACRERARAETLSDWLQDSLPAVSGQQLTHAERLARDAVVEGVLGEGMPPRGA